MELPQFNPKTIIQWNDALTDILVCLACRSLLLSLDPARLQRFYMASSTQQAAKVFSRAAIIRTIVPVLFLGVAIALQVVIQCLTLKIHSITSLNLPISLSCVVS